MATQVKETTPREVELASLPVSSTSDHSSPSKRKEGAAVAKQADDSSAPAASLTRPSAAAEEKMDLAAPLSSPCAQFGAVRAVRWRVQSGTHHCSSAGGMTSVCVCVCVCLHCPKPTAITSTATLPATLPPSLVPAPRCWPRTVSRSGGNGVPPASRSYLRRCSYVYCSSPAASAM